MNDQASKSILLKVKELIGTPAFEVGDKKIVVIQLMTKNIHHCDLSTSYDLEHLKMTKQPPQSFDIDDKESQSELVWEFEVTKATTTKQLIEIVAHGDNLVQKAEIFLEILE